MTDEQKQFVKSVVLPIGIIAVIVLLVNKCSKKETAEPPPQTTAVAPAAHLPNLAVNEIYRTNAPKMVMPDPESIESDMIPAPRKKEETVEDSNEGPSAL